MDFAVAKKILSNWFYRNFSDEATLLCAAKAIVKDSARKLNMEIPHTFLNNETLLSGKYGYSGAFPVPKENMLDENKVFLSPEYYFHENVYKLNGEVVSEIQNVVTFNTKSLRHSDAIGIIAHEVGHCFVNLSFCKNEIISPLELPLVDLKKLKNSEDNRKWWERGFAYQTQTCEFLPNLYADSYMRKTIGKNFSVMRSIRRYCLVKNSKLYLHNCFLNTRKYVEKQQSVISKTKEKKNKNMRNMVEIRSVKRVLHQYDKVK